ncbi:MAG: tRNA-uridine 2-sulfurtransferase [Patescibacteria group bacterium]|nr:tRNA-uridine 2-sulfurtransferase [Patescibacteria group bacterium]
MFVGMSGGVDSSLSAALLKEQGYDVTGVFIKVWQPDFIECTWKNDRLDAMRVASELEIPFVTLDLEKEYKQGVIDYMLSEYKEGRTPNPDVMCNREVKFGAFWKWAKEQGADFIATGHYAKTDHEELLVSDDKNKDQTYFLWMLTKNDLEHILFPIGHLKKDDVRNEAKNRGLYTSGKKDSQGLCFVGTIDIKTLLKEYIEEKIGDVKNEDGEVIGVHDGVTFYTIGERHGFTIRKKTTDDAPYYVIRKNIKNNELIVSHQKPEKKLHEEILLDRVNWVNGGPRDGFTYEARARYRALLANVTIAKKNDTWHASVISGDLVATPGQSLVFYDKEKCLGGGIIVY